MERASRQPHPKGPALRPVSAEWVLLASRLSRRRRFGCRLLDVRPGDSAPLTHVPGSAWLPTADGHDLPAHMLPRRERGFHVFADDPLRARAVAHALRRRGYRVAEITTPLPPTIWRPGPPTGALWQPDPYLSGRLESLPAASAGQVLDLGCGSGRDAVFLALHGYQVVGVDRLPDALELAKERAQHHGVEVRWRQRHISRVADLPGGPFALILALRFLPRAVLRGLHVCAAEGAQLILDVYGSKEGPDLQPACSREGPRRARHRIGPEELRDELSESGWGFLHGPVRRQHGHEVWVRATATRASPSGDA